MLEKLKTFPNDTEVLDTLSEVLITLNENKEAIDVINKSIQIEPNKNAEKYMSLGQISQYNDSLKCYKKGIEIYGGVKNLLNWTPNKGNPFIIACSNDPFDKNVQFDSSGKAMVTADNPYGLTFDPTYVYGRNQGIRGFLGIRYSFN